MTETSLDTAQDGFKHRRIAASGISLHAVEAGSGPLMLLVAGWPQTWYAWRKVMPELARHFRVVAIDLPGLGESDVPRDGYDTASIALHLDAVLDALGAETCLVVSHDIGAWVGYAYAARRPERVQRLVLIDAVIPGLGAPEAFRFAPETARKIWHFYFNYIPDLPELLVVGRERDFLTWSFRTKSVDLETAFEPGAIDAYVAAYSAPGRWSGGMGYYRAIFDSIAQNRDTMTTPLPMPVLAIGGSASLGDMMATAVRQAALDVEAAVIDECGHFVLEEQPGALLDVLLPFALAEPARN